MPVIDSDGQVIADAWVLAEPGTPPAPNTILPLAELLASNGATLPQPLGVEVPSDTAPETLVKFLPSLALVQVEFPKFRDGRGFSIARSLREKYAYTGDIRATGHFIPDQFLFLQQCGFSSFNPPPEHPTEQWQHPAEGPSQLLLRLVGRKTGKVG
jgi:uncharacterized protein (DUF934 family)